MVVLAWVRAPALHEGRLGGSWRAVLRDRVFTRYTLLNAAFMTAGISLVVELLPAFGKNVAGISEKEVGIVFALDALGVAIFQLPVVKLSEGRSRMRGMALMGTLWAATMLGVWAAGAWTHATAAFGILAGAVLVFAVGECLHGAIHTPLSVDLAPPQLVGRYIGRREHLVADRLDHRPGGRRLPPPAPAAPALADRGGRQSRLRRRRARARAAAARRGSPDAARASRFRCQFRRAGSISRAMPATADPLSTGAQPAAHPSAPRCSRTSGRGRRVPAPLSSAPAASPGSTSSAPTTEEAQQLATRFGWHPLDVEDVLSRRQRPKVDVYAGDDAGRGGYLFTVLHFPVYDAASAGSTPASSTPSRPATTSSRCRRSSCGRSASSSAARHESEDFREQLLSRGSGRLLYEVLDDLYDYCFPILDKIGFKLEQIDEEILVAGDGAKELVRDIHRVKQEIISYRKIVKPQRPT